MSEILPMDQRDGVIWLDGELVPWRDARIHVLTHGLHYASAVFEGERVYGDVVVGGSRHGRPPPGRHPVPERPE
jgi:branched-chain amino acid aminotransferase